IIEVQVSRRAVITALDVHHVAQVNGRTLLRAGDRYLAYVVFTLKLTGRVDGKVPSHSFQLTACWSDVARAQNFRQVPGLQAVRGYALLGIKEKDLLGQNARARYLRSLRDVFEPLLDDIREIIHLAVAVFVARNQAQPFARLLRVTDHHGWPAIRMKIRCLQPFVDKVSRVVEQDFIARVGDTVNPDEARVNDDVQVASHTLLFEIIG